MQHSAPPPSFAPVKVGMKRKHSQTGLEKGHFQDATARKAVQKPRHFPSPSNTTTPTSVKPIVPTGMDAVVAAAAASSATYHRRPRSPPTGDWKTLQCVTAPKMLTLAGSARQERAPADTSGFVLIKFQVVSVAPDDRPPQVEAAAAARTLHAMGSSAGPAQPSLPLPATAAAAPVSRPTSVAAVIAQTKPVIRTPSKNTGPRQAKNLDSKNEGTATPTSPGADSSSAGSGHGDLHHCRFPGCTKTFERRYNLRVHMRRHTGETPYPCKEPGCSQMFKWRSSLAHHMRTRHKMAVSGPMQSNEGGMISPAAVTDMRPSEDVAMAGRTVPYTTVQSPNGSSSGGSTKKGSDGRIGRPMLPPVAQLPVPSSRVRGHCHQMRREDSAAIKQPIRAQPKPMSPREIDHSAIRQDMHRPVANLGPQMRVSQQ